LDTSNATYDTWDIFGPTSRDGTAIRSDIPARCFGRYRGQFYVFPLRDHDPFKGNTVYRG